MGSRRADVMYEAYLSAALLAKKLSSNRPTIHISSMSNNVILSDILNEPHEKRFQLVSRGDLAVCEPTQLQIFWAALAELTSREGRRKRRGQGKVALPSSQSPWSLGKKFDNFRCMNTLMPHSRAADGWPGCTRVTCYRSIPKCCVIPTT